MKSVGNDFGVLQKLICSCGKVEVGVLVSGQARDACPVDSLRKRSPPWEEGGPGIRQLDW